MEFLFNLFFGIGLFVVIIIGIAGFSVWLENKLEEPIKNETIMGTLPMVNPNTFASKWATWMSTTIPQDEIVGTPEWERKYQPKGELK